MSKTKTKTNKAVSKKPKKASADVLNGNREWERSHFGVVLRDGDRTQVDGYVCGNFGVFLTAGNDDDVWAYLVHAGTGRVVGLFGSEDDAKLAAGIVEVTADCSAQMSEDDPFSAALTRNGFEVRGDFDGSGNVVWRLDRAARDKLAA